MFIHVFGGISSPSCSNYALIKSAADNQEEYGNDAAESLRRDFYVDDLLSSYLMTKKCLQRFHKRIKDKM